MMNPLLVRIALSVLPACVFAQLLCAQPEPGSPWPMFRGDARHTALSTFSGSRSGALLWSYATGSDMFTPPVIGADGRTYAASWDSRMYTLDSAGALLWSYQTGSYVSSCPAIGSEGRVYLGSGDDRFYAFESAGSMLWSYDLANIPYGFPTIGADGKTYVGAWYRLFVLAPSGTLAWSYSTATTDSMQTAPAVTANGEVYFGAYDNNLYALDSAASLKWSYRTGDNVQSSPALRADGAVLAGSCDRRLYALTSSGSLLWSYGAGNEIRYCSPAVGSDGRAYIGSLDMMVYALSSPGTLLWSYGMGGGINYSSPAIGSGGEVFQGANDNTVYALNSAGSLLWSYCTAEGIQSSVAIGADGIVAVGSSDNVLYCFKDPTATPTSMPTVTPTATPAVTPTPTIASPLSIEPGVLKAGETFTFTIRLSQDVQAAFDYYIVADTASGQYTLCMDGRTIAGIAALYENVPGYRAPFEQVVNCTAVIPPSMGGQDVVFYTAAIEAGRVPPVSSLAELTPATLYVIMLGKTTAAIGD